MSEFGDLRRRVVGELDRLLRMDIEPPQAVIALRNLALAEAPALRLSEDQVLVVADALGVG